MYVAIATWKRGLVSNEVLLPVLVLEDLLFKPQNKDTHEDNFMFLKTHLHVMWNHFDWIWVGGGGGGGGGIQNPVLKLCAPSEPSLEPLLFFY